MASLKKSRPSKFNQFYEDDSSDPDINLFSRPVLKKKKKKEKTKYARKVKAVAKSTGSSHTNENSEAITEMDMSIGDKDSKDNAGVPLHASGSGDEQETSDSESSDIESQMRIGEKDEFALLRKELAEMPFDELEKLKQKIGLKMYKEVMQSGIKPTSSGRATFKRENKNRPMEMSSKKKPPKLRQSVVVKKKLKRDPRFDYLSGQFDEKLFKHSYQFLFDMKQKEKLVLMKQCKYEKDEDRKQQIQSLLKRMNQQEQSERDKEARAERLTQIKKKEREMIKQGKTPYYLKQSDKKKIELAEKFKKLKKSGKIEQYMQKKRRKNAAKERRKLPNK